ncbi:MAG: ATP-binding protein [Candidatus Tantalella remota]|nr:ATP-binding protein [Candidatus Tantalella remota]
MASNKVSQHIITNVITNIIIITFTLTSIPCLEEAHALSPWAGSQRVAVRRAMLDRAIDNAKVSYAEEGDPLLKDTNGLLLSHGKILLSPELKNDSLKKLRVIFHEEIEAVMQILARQDRARYSHLINMILSDNAIVTAYRNAFPSKNTDIVSDEMLCNDIIASAFELLLLFEESAVSSKEITKEERAFIEIIRPAIDANKHSYFTGMFWDQYARELHIRAAIANGQKFTQARQGTGEVGLVVGQDDESVVQADVAASLAEEEALIEKLREDPLSSIFGRDAYLENMLLEFLSQNGGRAAFDEVRAAMVEYPERIVRVVLHDLVKNGRVEIEARPGRPGILNLLAGGGGGDVKVSQERENKHRDEIKKRFEDYEGEIYYPTPCADFGSFVILVAMFPKVSRFVYRDGFYMDEVSYDIPSPKDINQVSAFLGEKLARLEKGQVATHEILVVDDRTLDIKVSFKKALPYAGRTVHIRYEVGDIFENDNTYGMVYVRQPGLAGQISAKPAFWEKMKANTSKNGLILVSSELTHFPWSRGLESLLDIKYAPGDWITVYRDPAEPSTDERDSREGTSSRQGAGEEDPGIAPQKDMPYKKWYVTARHLYDETGKKVAVELARRSLADVFAVYFYMELDYYEGTGRRIVAHIPAAPFYFFSIASKSKFKHVNVVIGNVLSNALKYGGTEDVTVRLQPRGADLHIEIEDHGRGIPAEEIGHLTELEYRGSNVGDKYGCGDGLALTKEYLEKLNATMDIRSEVGKGTIVSIDIPDALERSLLPDAETVQHLIARQASAAGTKARQGNGENDISSEDKGATTDGVSNMELYLSEVLSVQNGTFMLLVERFSRGAKISMKEASWLAALLVCDVEKLTPLDQMKVGERLEYLEFTIKILEDHLKGKPTSRNISLQMIKRAKLAFENKGAFARQGEGEEDPSFAADLYERTDAQLVFPAGFRADDARRKEQLHATITELYELLKYEKETVSFPGEPLMRIDLGSDSVTLSDGVVLRDIDIYDNRFCPVFLVPGEGRYVKVDFNQNPRFYGLYKTLFYLLKGNELDLIFPFDSDPSPKGDGAWDSWHTDMDWQFVGRTNPYPNEIDPLVVEAVTKAIFALGLDGDPEGITVLDIFGGSGRMIEKLDGNISKRFDGLGAEKPDMKYFVIDRNKSNIDHAHARLSGLDVTILKRDMTVVDNIAEEIGNVAHIVVCEGGLTYQVVNRDEAEQIAGRVYDVLVPGGVFVVTGYNPSLLSAPDFEKIGFRVLNKSIPKNTLNYDKTAQFYVLMKPLSQVTDKKNADDVDEIRSEPMRINSVEDIPFEDAVQALAATVEDECAGYSAHLRGKLTNDERSGQSLILYADDMLEGAAILDLNRTLKNTLGSGNIFAGGKIIIFAREKSNGIILEKMINDAAPSVETLMISTEELARRKNICEGEEDEIKALVQFAKTKGANDILALIKGPVKDLDTVEKLAPLAKKLNVPVVIMEGGERVVYSFAQAIALAITMKQDEGAKGWLIVLPPVRRITDDMELQYQQYHASRMARVAV